MIAWLFQFFAQWYIWVPLVAILAYMTYRNYKKVKVIDTYDYVLLTLEIPRNNDKKELAAEQLFASLHGILRDKQELSMTGGLQEHLSFEIASVGGQIRFFVRVPKHLQNFVEGQIYAQYPTVQIHEADDDYAANGGHHPVAATAELVLTDDEFLPIKTFQSFEVDPLAGITAALSKLNQQKEEIWVQILARPIADDWHAKAAKFVARLKSGFGSKTTSGGWVWFAQIIGALWAPPEGGAGSTTTKEMSERDKTRVSEAEKKSQKLGYQVKIRIAYLGSEIGTARGQLNAVASAFKQFNSTNLNGFRLSSAPSFRREDLQKYTARYFADSGFILNIEELASVFHLPHTNVETPSVVWANSKTAEPPSKLPVLTGERAHDDQISAFGLTNFRGMQQQFGMYRADRSRHVYIIGQTGVGKSGLLELLALSDVFHNQGYAIIDPHGDFAIDNLKFIPSGRIKDVVYFNPADTAFPLGFNPMEVFDPSQKSNISSEIIGVLKRMFGDSWGPRLEYILRYTILALLDYPDTTMLDITRMLTDKKFREKVLAEVKDTVVLQFWRVEFASWNDKFVAEAIAPVLNKVGAFVANPIIRNIIGQPKSTFNIREIMDEGKILIVNLSKGLIGEDNASILGSFMVTKIQLAAMSRSDIESVEDRRPFYLYVDEFQNFATDSFAVILSEARKYGLNLTVANQYVSQMSETVRDAVFGNVGTIIGMRVSAEDAPILATQFAPHFEALDILQMNNRAFVCSMMISGEKNPAFSGTTLKLPPAQVDYLQQIIENTRHNFSRPRQEVEEKIAAQITPPINLQSRTAQRAARKAENETSTDNISPAGKTGPQKLDLTKANQPAPTNQNTAPADKKPSKQKLADLTTLVAAAQTVATSTPDLASEYPNMLPGHVRDIEKSTNEAELVLRRHDNEATATDVKNTRSKPATAAPTDLDMKPKRKRSRSRRKKTTEPNDKSAGLPPPPTFSH
ncbi:type IV secretion system DNA-binding domain-containing protein [Candidatus Saccharibacteria bacterium]|nr:type IV secretion system DNA-binding domain-containing protein [Candidatus Saccharibacteria bacterium]